MEVMVMRTRSAALLSVLSLLIGLTAIVASAGAAGARPDETPPIVELHGPEDGAVVEAADLAEVECSATDDVRLRGTCTIEFLEERSESEGRPSIDVSVTATAVDRRDNSANVTSSFTILFDLIAPIASDDRTIGLLGEGPIVIDVLANDYDADGDLDASTLRITSHPDTGAALVDADNAVVVFEPATTGAASLNYEVCDAAGACASATVLITVLDESDCTISGTDGDDELVGTHGDDVICGFEGNDSITAHGGNDIVFAGSGADVAIGSGGGDALFGGPGDDYLRGGAGEDYLDGGAGNDLLKGENHADVVIGSTGNDEVHGGLSDDIVSGGAGDDVAYGWAGDDVVLGGLGADIVRGGTGSDDLHGGASDDFLHGEGDDDVLVGGAGFDNGDAGKEHDACVGIELRLRCERYGVNVDRVAENSATSTLSELAPAEHDVESDADVPAAQGELPIGEFDVETGAEAPAAEAGLGAVSPEGEAVVNS